MNKKNIALGASGLIVGSLLTLGVSAGISPASAETVSKSSKNSITVTSQTQQDVTLDTVLAQIHQFVSIQNTVTQSCTNQLKDANDSLTKLRAVRDQAIQLGVTQSSSTLPTNE